MVSFARKPKREVAMGKIIVEMTMSLDGYTAGLHVNKQNPMGVGGERLHHWIIGSKNGIDAGVIAEGRKNMGAVILGKTMFDVGLQFWEDTPYPVPSFVLTHESRVDQQMKSAAFTFIDDGIESALQKAKDIAGGKNIHIIGGANVVQQFIKARRFDELHLHIVHILLGEGDRLFDNINNEQVELDCAEIIPSTGVTHYKFHVRK